MDQERERAELRLRVETDPIDNTWLEEYQQGEPTTDPEALAWMRSRPAVIKDLMRRFPPACVVAARRPLRLPRPGEYAIVQSYTEDGQLSVMRGAPDAVPVCAYCDADWLICIAFHRGMTPEWVAAVLSRPEGDEV